MKGRALTSAFEMNFFTKLCSLGASSVVWIDAWGRGTLFAAARWHGPAAAMLLTGALAWGNEAARAQAIAIPSTGAPLWNANGIASRNAAPAVDEPAQLYPPAEKLVASPGNTTYFVDPKTGDDANLGRKAGAAWKSLAQVNALKLAPGDRVIIRPGIHQETLKPTAQGTVKHPVIIEFLPGVHEFPVARALCRPWYISNSCDAPQDPKPAAILVENSQHLEIRGGGTHGPNKTLLLLGRMIALINQNAKDIAYKGLVFDLKRPTVSEFRVAESGPNYAEIQIAEGSTYEIRNGRFAWTGDLGSGWVMAQQAEPATGKCWRMGRWDPFADAQATELGNRRVRLSYTNGNLGMLRGRQFQFRRVLRDSAAGLNARSQNLRLCDCEFLALVNMGLVSQFCENITFRRVNVAPPPGTIRTCPAWADCFHFSGCRGDILVDSCRFSGTQDDPINVHGTHLKIIGQTSDRQLHVRFMHNQTYGFAPFTPGDEIAVIRHDTLRELPGNPRRRVWAVAPKPDEPAGKDWLLTLDGTVPAFHPGDVVDNLTWYPNFTATNCLVTMDSCRGFLITTRGKVRVEGNTFHRCAMPGLLVEDDAEGWFESGPVRDMIIRKNTFIGSGIVINPQSHSTRPDEPVHENIRILDNLFKEGAGIAAHHVQGLTIAGNRTEDGSDVKTELAATCTEVRTTVQSHEQ